MFDSFKKKKEVQTIGFRYLPEDDPRRYHPVISETGRERVIDTYSLRYDKNKGLIYDTYSPEAFETVDGKYDYYLRMKKECGRSLNNIILLLYYGIFP